MLTVYFFYDGFSVRGHPFNLASRHVCGVKIIYGVKFIGSIKSLTTAFMVFSTAFGTAVFGLLIDIGYSIENIALISGAYILVSLALLLLIKKNLKPLKIRK